MRVAIVVTVVIVAAVAVLAITKGGSSDKTSAAPSQAAIEKAFAGSPPALTALHNDAGELLGGGTTAFKQRLADLRGHPVVVNKWAAWCGPCRQEFPVFQKAAVRFGKRVAFIGVDSNDNDGSAKGFLKKFPVTYPSYSDPNLKIAAFMDAVGAFPTTVMFNSQGKQVNTHLGPYTSEAALAADIKRFGQ